MNAMQPIACDACRHPTVAHDVVNLGSMEGGYRQLCGRCFNEAAATRLGLQGFEHVVFEPVRMVSTGVAPSTSSGFAPGGHVVEV